MADLFATTFRLTRGQRCPAGIAALAALYEGAKANEEAIAAAVHDYTLALVDCADPAKVADWVGEEIDRLHSQGLTLADIGVVHIALTRALVMARIVGAPRPGGEWPGDRSMHR